MSEALDIRETIKNNFGLDLPISGGWGNSIDNAVVVLYQIPNDYVSVEYSFINCIANRVGFTWTVVSQNLEYTNHRRYDVIQIEAVAEDSGGSRSKIMRFYFDISDCFGK